MAHLHGVALAAAILAKKRGQNAELATMAGMLHDLWAYKSGSYDDHAHLGADYARKVLGELTTPEETEIICSAIYHHDSKAEVDAPMDEILKDADVIDHSLSDPTKEVKAHEKERYEKLCAEMGLTEQETDQSRKRKTEGSHQHFDTQPQKPCGTRVFTRLVS